MLKSNKNLVKQFSWGAIFRGSIFLGGIFPGGNFLGGGLFPGGKFLGGIFPGGFFPGGIFPDTLKSTLNFQHFEKKKMSLIHYVFPKLKTVKNVVT